MMKERIENLLRGRYNHYISNAKRLTLIDWKDINDECLKVHETLPIYNPETGIEVKGVEIKNDIECRIGVDSFGENALKISRGRHQKQCECVVYPENADTEEWVLFVEMKYADNIRQAFNPIYKYPETAIKQIISTVDYFRLHGILKEDKIVNAIVSFPNILSSFNSFVLTPEQIIYYLTAHKIIIRATNYVNVISDVELEMKG